MSSRTDEESTTALGAVIEADRGSLPFELLHGEALVTHAVWGLRDAGIHPVDLSTTWAGLAEAGEPLVLHDPLCPATPPQFLARCAAAAIEHQAVVVGVRPVTDTVKTIVDGALADTVDRAGLRGVASPIVLPGAVIAALDALPTTDFAKLAVELARRFPVITLTAPSTARRVGTRDDVRLLEAFVDP